MKQAVRTVVALAAGIGLAAAAQAQGAYMPGAAPTTKSQAAAPGQMPRLSAASGKLSRQQVREAQQQLKSEGFYKGRIDGMMSHRTRLAITRFQRHNGLPRTAILDRKTLDRLVGKEGLGVGSSMPSVHEGTPNNLGTTPVTPPANPAPTGAGGNNAPMTDQSTGNK